jgi:aminopeptidase YwaD
LLGSLARLREALEALSGFVEAGRAFHVLKRVTLEHRVQGAPGLGEAARTVEELLLSNPLLPLDVNHYDTSPGGLPEWLPAPPEWSVESAELSWSGGRLRLEGHPTLAAAHSPPGGPLSGEVVRVEEWWRPEAYEAASGRIALTSGPQDVAYTLASQAGALALLLYTPSLPGDAVPYKGLFLPPETLTRAGMPALTAPSGLAGRLEGSEARVGVDSTLGGPARMPVVEAVLPGRGGGPRVAVVAHLCHPRPGANDNASGSAALVEAALALAEAVDQGRLRPPRGDIVFLLVPEYTGSVYALERGLRADYAINLDMVGVEPGGGDGPLRLVPPPPPLPLEPAAALYYALRLRGAGGWVLAGPESGSDHDAFNSYGIPAAMLNQWPDTYYHSDRDDADRISPQRLALAAHVAAAAAYALATWEVDVEPFADHYTRLLAERHAARGDDEAALLAASTLRTVYHLDPLASPPSGYRPQPPWGGVSPASRIILPTAVTARDPEAGARLRRALAGGGLEAYAALLMEPLVMAWQGLGLRESVTLIQALHGVRRGPGLEGLWRVLETLESVGALRLS